MLRSCCVKMPLRAHRASHRYDSVHVPIAYVCVSLTLSLFQSLHACMRLCMSCCYILISKSLEQCALLGHISLFASILCIHIFHPCNALGIAWSNASNDRGKKSIAGLYVCVNVWSTYLLVHTMFSTLNANASAVLKSFLSMWHMYVLLLNVWASWSISNVYLWIKTNCKKMQKK